MVRKVTNKHDPRLLSKGLPIEADRVLVDSPPDTPMIREVPSKGLEMVEKKRKKGR